jgi:hypothetical protein
MTRLQRLAPGKRQRRKRQQESDDGRNAHGCRISSTEHDTDEMGGRPASGKAVTANVTGRACRSGLPC